MNTTCDFLDAVKQRHAVPSDYALSKKLGVTQQEISKYRMGKACLGDSTAIRVAELLEMDPGIVVAAIHHERAKKPDEKALWAAMLEKLGGIASLLLLGFSALGAPPPANAAPPQNVTGIGIMSNRRRYAKRHRTVDFAILNPLERFFLLKKQFPATTT